MPSLFRKKYDYQTDFLPQTNRKFQHLDRVVKANTAIVREPRMEGSGATVVFLPYPDFDNPNYRRDNAVMPDRLSEESRDYGPWLFGAEGVRKFGKTPVTLLFDNPDDSGFNMRDHHPIQLIWDTAIRTVRSKQIVNTPFGSSDSDKWAVLLNGDDSQANSFGSLAKPDNLLLGYVLVYNLGEENFMLTGNPLGGLDNDPPVVWVMSRSTAQDMLAQIDDKEAPISGAKVFHYYNRKTNNCPAMVAATTASTSGYGLGGSRRTAPAASGGQGQQQGQLAGYGVYVTDTLTGRPADPKVSDGRTGFEQFACKKLKPWEQVLRGHTPDECAQVAGNYCGLPLSLLYHAWKSHPEWYTDEIKRGLTNPTTVDMRGSQPAGRTGSGLGLPGGQKPTPAPQDPEPPAKDFPMSSLGDAAFSGAGEPGQNDSEIDEAALAAANAAFRKQAAARAGGRA